MPTEAEKLIFGVLADRIAPKDDTLPSYIEPAWPAENTGDPANTWTEDFVNLVFVDETPSGRVRHWTPATDSRTSRGYVAGTCYGAAAAREYIEFVECHCDGIVERGGVLQHIVLAMLDHAKRHKMPHGEVVGFFTEIEAHIARAAAAKGGA
jgi:hypothetical protein